MRNCLFVALLCGIQAQFDDAINDLLLKDGNMAGPGVRARLTLNGTSYVSSIVARALTTEVATINLPFEEKTVTLVTLPTVSISSMKLQLFQVPNSFDVASIAPNIVSVSMQSMNLSVSALGSGHIGGIILDGPLEVKTGKFSLDVSVRIRKNNRGNPSLKIELCRVAPNIPVIVAVAKPLTPESGKMLAEAISRSGHTLFENLICPRLIFITETRINQRFGLLPSRISLGDTTNFSLIRSLSGVTDKISLGQKLQTVLRDQKTIRVKNQAVTTIRTGSSLRIGSITGTKRSSRMLQTEMKSLRHIRQNAALQAVNLRSPRSAAIRRRNGEIHRKQRAHRQSNFHLITNTFNLSHVDNLFLDYGILSTPSVTKLGVEIETSGEISAAHIRTPFGPRPLVLPLSATEDMLQVVVSDYVPNTLMYHGHRTGLFNTRVDSSTPQFGSLMQTTCDLSTGSLFCVGDLFPTLRDMIPNKRVAFLFSTLKAPAILVQPESLGGIFFQLTGLIEISSIDSQGEIPVASMEIHIEATMKMKLTAKTVRGRVNLKTIRLISRTPHILVQDELDDAGLLSREILQRMVNDILKQGIPIPVHPLFKLHKPKLTLLDRSMLLETDFQLNQELIRQLTVEKLTFA